MNTYQWDYAFALKIETVNEIIQANMVGSSPSLSYETVDSDSGTSISITVSLAPWVIAGGQNQLLYIDMSIASGALTLSGGSLPASTIDLTGVTMQMEAQLGWIGPGGTLQAAGSGTVDQLVFGASTPVASNPGYVAVRSITDPHGVLDSLSTGLLRAAFVETLVANRGAVQYVLADINPAPANLASWLHPTTWTYFYSEAGDTGALCILSMLTAEPLPPPAFDSTAFIAGDNAILLISQPVFLANVVLPALTSTFPGAKFSLSSANGVATLQSTTPFTVGSLTATQMVVAATAQGNGLQVHASGGGPLQFLFGLASLPDASYTWSVSATNPMQLTGQVIGFQPDPNPVANHDYTMYWYDWALLVVVGITGAVGLSSAITDMVSGFSASISGSGLPAINTAINTAMAGSTANLASIVGWSKGAMTLTATAADMADAVRIGGNFQ